MAQGKKSSNGKITDRVTINIPRQHAPRWKAWLEQYKQECEAAGRDFSKSECGLIPMLFGCYALTDKDK